MFCLLKIRYYKLFVYCLIYIIILHEHDSKIFILFYFIQMRMNISTSHEANFVILYSSVSVKNKPRECTLKRHVNRKCLRM